MAKLTDEALNEAFDGAFDKPMNLDHKPTTEEIFTIRLRAVANLAVEEIKKELEERCPHAPRNFPSDKRMCIQCWQSFWEEWGVK